MDSAGEGTEVWGWGWGLCPCEEGFLQPGRSLRKNDHPAFRLLWPRRNEEAEGTRPELVSGHIWQILHLNSGSRWSLQAGSSVNLLLDKYNFLVHDTEEWRYTYVCVCVCIHL